MAITWNPSDTSIYVDLSNANMTASGNSDSNFGLTRTTESKTSGKWYWEVRIDLTMMFSIVGVGTASAAINNYVGHDSHGYGYVSDCGSKIHSDSWDGYGSNYWSTHVIGIALDLDNGKVWFARNNVWQASGNPVTGVNPAYSGLSGTFFPMYSPCMGFGGDDCDRGTGRFDAGDFSYSPPSGFLAYESTAALTATGLLDGKLSVNSPTGLLDGKLRVPEPTSDLLDGKLSVNSPTDLLDGKARIKDTTTTLLDGKALIKDSTTTLLDGKITLFIQQRQRLLNAYVNFLGIHNILVPLGVTLDQLINVPLAQIEIQSILNQLSVHIVNIQTIKNKLTIGDPFTGLNTFLNSIQSDAGSQILVNELSLAITKIQTIKNTLSESFTSKISLINELSLKNDIQGLITLLNGLSEQTTLYPSCSIDVYLEGKQINKQINNLNITMDREVLFDTVSFSSKDKHMYTSINNVVGTESEIEIHYKGTSWAFLVEDVSGYELDFTVWGRSIAAKSDTPFKDSTDFVLDIDTMASDLAEDLVPDLAVTWNVIDWMVSEGWTATGTPVQKLQELAGSVGAVVRMYPDGTGLHVDQKYLVRPVDLPYAAAVEEFDRDTNLVSLDNSCIIGTKDNAVTVYGYSPINERSVLLEAEACVELGNTALIKVYPGLGGAGYSLESSADSPIYQHKKTEKFTEIINFIGGKGSVNYPIVDLESISWDGAVPSGFDFTIGQNEIVVDNNVAAVGEVTYTTSYDVWYAGHAGEGQIVVVCVPENGGGIVARVYFGDGDREADSIEQPTLTSIEAVIAVGTAYLDDSHTKLIRKISVPCSGVFDGEVISIQSIESGVTGNAIVSRHEINAGLENNTLKIWSTIDAIQYT